MCCARWCPLRADAPTSPPIPPAATLPALPTVQATLWHHSMVAAGCDMMEGFEALAAPGAAADGLATFLDWVSNNLREVLWVLARPGGVHARSASALLRRGRCCASVCVSLTELSQ